MSLNPQIVYFVNPGGLSVACGVSAPSVVKTIVSRTLATVIHRIIVIAPGTSGNLTVNDEVALGSETAGNTVFSVPYTALTAGKVYELRAPCINGIVFSSVPAGGVFTVTYT